tara:strand:- start:408 stop:533 length:126 start_codon:yes stop_codon:yes gene_type:complete
VDHSFAFNPANHPTDFSDLARRFQVSPSGHPLSSKVLSSFI